MQPGSVRRMIIRNRDTIDICEKQSEVPNERIILGNDYNSLINFINLLEIVQISLTFILYDIDILREQKLLRKTLSFP